MSERRKGLYPRPLFVCIHLHRFYLHRPDARGADPRPLSHRRRQVRQVQDEEQDKVQQEVRAQWVRMTGTGFRVQDV
jgi:hypothetical protein